MSIINLAVATSSLSLEAEEVFALESNSETLVLAAEDDGDIADDESTDAVPATPASVTEIQGEAIFLWPTGLVPPRLGEESLLRDPG